MPESARAYGLKVVEGEIDERLNSVKATEAGVHFLTDLHRQVGAWDLALAAYNMGPYGLVGRLVRVGGDAGYWDLVDANLLPDETAGYVPSIEAFALILENLNRLDFGHDSRPVESTAEVSVKPGMRLSFIARAAHTSTLRIRDLNREFLKDTVPSGEFTARVPDSEAHRAQVFIDSVSPSDDRDTCVPEDFDWGAKVYETSRWAAACHADAGARGDGGPARAKP
jgi:membrane-bound lytic murein transglycosylase D